MTNRWRWRQMSRITWSVQPSQPSAAKTRRQRGSGDFTLLQKSDFHKMSYPTTFTFIPLLEFVADSLSFYIPVLCVKSQILCSFFKSRWPTPYRIAENIVKVYFTLILSDFADSVTDLLPKSTFPLIKFRKCYWISIFVSQIELHPRSVWRQKLTILF